MSSEWTPLNDRSLIRRAEEFLTEYILSGTVTPGDYLPPEQALGRKLGIGRSTIREAISVLESKGLVERQHGVGVRVIDRSQEAASAMLALMLKRQGVAAGDLLAVRQLYEVQAAEWAAARATDEDLRSLREALAAMRREDATLEQCVEADLEFHAAVAAASHNPVLEWLVAALRSLLLDAIRTTMPEGVRPEGVYRQHLPILEAIERRDGVEAARAMQEHLRFLDQRLQQAGETGPLPRLNPRELPMLVACLSLVLLVVAPAALAAPAGEVQQEADRLAPRVAITSDADFFAAWALDHPGMEAVRAAVRAGDFPRARVALGSFLQRRQPPWRINAWEMPAAAQGKPEEHAQYQRGQDALAHKFGGVQFGDRINWSSYPRRLPNGGIDYEALQSPDPYATGADILGPLYWFTHDERYAREFVDEVTDFIRTWPAPERYWLDAPGPWRRLRSVLPLCGSGWSAYNYFLTSPAFTPEAHALVLQDLIEKMRYAMRNPNSVNRYLYQRRGIYNTAAYFPELKDAGQVRDYAVRAAISAWEDGFYPDKITKELCPAYHSDSSSALLQNIANTARMMGYEIPADLRRALESVYDFYPMVVTPLNSLPDFGDTWGEGNVDARVRNALTLIDKPSYRFVASRGREGAPPEFTSIHLPWAGFYFMRSGWDRRSLYLALRAGPRGRDHWHEDFNSFECYGYGEKLVSEVGVYDYATDPFMRYFRTSPAHNLVIVDGLTQNRSMDPSTRETDHPREDDWHSDAVFDLAWGVYNGKWSDMLDARGEHARELATHRRDICFVKDSYWIVSDRLTAPGSHRYAQLFHFLPDRTVIVAPGGRAGTADPGRANVMLIQADAVAPRIIRGQEDPIQGWASRARGKKEPAAMVSFDQTAAERARYDTVVLPLDAGQPADITVERLPVRDAEGHAVPASAVCALRIVTPRGSDLYVNDLRQEAVGPPNGRLKIVGDLRTDARAAVVRLDPGGSVRAASSVGGTVLTLKGKALEPR